MFTEEVMKDIYRGEERDRELERDRQKGKENGLENNSTSKPKKNIHFPKSTCVVTFKKIHHLTDSSCVSWLGQAAAVHALCIAHVGPGVEIADHTLARY